MSINGFDELEYFATRARPRKDENYKVLRGRAHHYTELKKEG